MATPQHQVRSVEYISSPPPPPAPTNPPHPQQTVFYQHPPPPPPPPPSHLTALISPTSPLPPQFNGSVHHPHPIPPLPGTSPYSHHAAQHQQPLPAPQHGTQFSQVSLPPPNFALINNGSYSALSPPSISWITHTQSPPLHPFPPPSTPLTHIHPIQSGPPRLSHSPVIPPQAYTYHDPAYMPQQVQAPVPTHPPQPLPPNFHPVHQHHSVPDLHGGAQQAFLQVHSGGVPHLQNHPQILSPPYHYHPHLPQEHMPPAPPHHDPRLHGSPPLQSLPTREAWMRSPPPPPPPPPPPGPQPQQQFHQLPSALNRIPTMPQSHSQSVIQPHPPLLPHVRVQFLPRTPGRPVVPTRIGGKTVANGHILSPPSAASSQVSEQVTSTTVQLLQPPLQPVSVSTVVRPTPIYTTQAPPGFLSSSSESGFPAAIPGLLNLSQRVSAEQQRSLVEQQQWIAARSQGMPLTSSVLTTLPQGSRPDTVLEQTQPMAIPMSSQEAKELDEYNDFATIFRNHRFKLGYTHADVIQQVGIRYGYSFSINTIAKFELVQLSIDTVRALKPILQMWLKDTVKAAGTSEEEMKEIIVHASTSINPKRERKRRTNVDSVIKSQLEEEFRRKRTPSQSEMQVMANRLGMEKEFIRVWFCNRRQRQKKLEKELKTRASRQTSSSSPKTTIPSPSHDITVEVPSIDPRDMGSPIHEGYKLHKAS